MAPEPDFNSLQQAGSVPNQPTNSSTMIAHPAKQKHLPQLQNSNAEAGPSTSKRSRTGIIRPRPPPIPKTLKPQRANNWHARKRDIPPEALKTKGMITQTSILPKVAPVIRAQYNVCFNSEEHIADSVTATLVATKVNFHVADNRVQELCNSLSTGGQIAKNIGHMNDEFLQLMFRSVVQIGLLTWAPDISGNDPNSIYNLLHEQIAIKTFKQISISGGYSHFPVNMDCARNFPLLQRLYWTMCQHIEPPTPEPSAITTLPKHIAIDYFEPEYWNEVLTVQRKVELLKDGYIMDLPQAKFMQKYGEAVLELYDMPTDKQIDRVLFPFQSNDDEAAVSSKEDDTPPPEPEQGPNDGMDTEIEGRGDVELEQESGRDGRGMCYEAAAAMAAAHCGRWCVTGGSCGGGTWYMKQQLQWLLLVVWWTVRQGEVVVMQQGVIAAEEHGTQSSSCDGCCSLCGGWCSKEVVAKGQQYEAAAMMAAARCVADGATRGGSSERTGYKAAAAMAAACCVRDDVTRGCSGGGTGCEAAAVMAAAHCVADGTSKGGNGKGTGYKAAAAMTAARCVEDDVTRGGSKGLIVWQAVQ
ncbi:hypothetical protein CVT25_004857 [Psilocybe cyanescens]|uniref:Uncharacterized protein n=1 Tax=Psilocybe cyanescens TaxID=93625 RepID=A0A409VXX5_PSICY|nr:hypothetical protein CVT25_004857 [Psilocybe cyanescens]